MFKLIFAIIIVYIIIQTLLDDSDSKSNIRLDNYKKPEKIIPDRIIPDRIIQERANSNFNNKIFDNPNPWTRIIYIPNNEFPYFYHIKIKISSLNDYENWKKIIPNIDFNSNTGELIIPSKDEPSALAIVNLIINNFMGKISLKDIIDKDLIQISIAKAQNYEVVQKKLREQINECLYSKTNIKPNYEKDLINVDIKKSNKIDFINNDNHKISESQGAFPSTQRFLNNSYESFDNNIEPFEGSDYSYI